MLKDSNWQPQLENNLVRIEPLQENDFDKLYEVASDPLIWVQHPAKDRYKKEVFQMFFDQAIKGKTAFTIIDKKTDQIVGSTRYYNVVEGTSVAIGYTFLSRNYWGGQYNKACKNLLIELAFLSVDTIYLHIGSENLRSQIATQRNGAIKSNETVSEINGIKEIKYEYSIARKDWKPTV